MSGPGAPISYLTLAEGTPVVTSDGRRIGTVHHVLAVPEDDIFDGLIVDTADGMRFVDAPLVDTIYEREVRLGIDSDAARTLPEPSENPAALEATPDDIPESNLTLKLRRAWDYLSGNY
jgi:hypothetical protein